MADIFEDFESPSEKFLVSPLRYVSRFFFPFIFEHWRQDDNLIFNVWHFYLSPQNTRLLSHSVKPNHMNHQHLQLSQYFAFLCQLWSTVMLPIFLKYVLASKAAFFTHISPRFLVFCAIEHVCFVHAFLLTGLSRLGRAFSFLPPAWPFPSRRQASTKAPFIPWKRPFLGVFLTEFLVLSLRLHSILKALAKPTESKVVNNLSEAARDVL